MRLKMMQAAGATAALFVMAVFTGEACSPAINKQIAKSVIDIALAACIAENPGNDMETLKALCHYTDELAPTVKDILEAQKKGSLKLAAAKKSDCKTEVKDAGKD